MITALHHVQLAMPEGAEDAARRFYGDVLGLPEERKPSALKGRGGVWFRSGALRVHLGVESPFIPARKAHPAFQVLSLPDAVARLDARGIAYRRDVDLPGLTRIYVDDPFRNRIEICQVIDG